MRIEMLNALNKDPLAKLNRENPMYEDVVQNSKYPFEEFSQVFSNCGGVRNRVEKQSEPFPYSIAPDSPYYSRIQEGLERKWPDRVLHDLPLAYLEAGELPNVKVVDSTKSLLSNQENSTAEWFVIHTSLAKILVHRDFLEIQDQFNQLNPADKNAVWNAELALEAFKNYFSVMEEYREHRNDIFQRALELLPFDEIKTGIKNKWTEIQQNKDVIPDLVAIPFYEDNPNLWNNFYKLTQDLRSGIVYYQKMTSNNLMFASIKDRFNHDYFNFAEGMAAKGNTKSIEDTLMRTARHEGTHWGTDSLLEDEFLQLDPSEDSPLAEGLTFAISHDARIETTSASTLDEFLLHPLSPQMAYNASPKFFKALSTVLSKQQEISYSEIELWARIESIMLRIGYQIYADEEKQKMSSEKKIQILLASLMRELRVTKEQLTLEYDRLIP